MAKPKEVRYVDAQLYEMLQAIQRRMEKDPGWHVVARGRDWLCPYCGEIGFTNYEATHAPREVLKHLVHTCPYWGEDVGTRFSQKDLLAKARRLDIEELLHTHRAWRMADGTGRWYCPYCAEATSVPWEANSRDRSPDAARVCAHLEVCKAARSGRKPYPVEVLHQAIEDADRCREFTISVRVKIESDAAWQKAVDGKWVCPRCHQALAEVDFATDLQKRGLAPRRIARHLLERCRPQRENPALAITPPPPPAQVTVTHDTRAIVIHEDQPEADEERAREDIRKVLPAAGVELEGYDIAFLRRAGVRVGGAFHDCSYLSPEDVALLLCGLHRRGAEAAAAILAIQRLVRHHATQHRSPAEVLRRTNDDLMAKLGGHSPITAFYGVLEGKTGILTYARAGHSMPILYNARDEPPLRELGSRGVALGLHRGAAFDQAIEDVAIHFRHGDTFLAYTGAVADVANAAGESYGVARLGRLLARAHGAQPSRALTFAIAEDIQHFLGDQPPADDLTLLCIRCL